jgi:hypothetical protein
MDTDKKYGWVTEHSRVVPGERVSGETNKKADYWFCNTRIMDYYPGNPLISR